MDDIEHLIPNSIKLQILAYPLSYNNNEEDFIRWHYSKLGDFDIKSASHLQNQTYSLHLSNGSSWWCIWKIKFPYKYKMLLWNCCREILPVAEKLNHVIGDISPMCSRCLGSMEDHLHLFRDCPQSSVLWSFIFQRIWKNENFDCNSFYNTSWKD